MGFERESNPTTTTETTHKDTSLVLLDEDENIYKEQFELDNIKKRFPEDKYNIAVQEDEWGNVITVIDKKTKSKKVEYVLGSYDIEIQSFNKNGNENERVTVRLPMLVFSSLEEKLRIGTITRYTPTGYDFYIYGIDGQIEELRKYEKNNNDYEIIENTFYTNNEPFQIKKHEKTVKNSIVNELVAILNNKNLFGILKSPNELLAITNKIDERIVYDVLSDYRSLVGRDLMDDIENAASGGLKSYFLGDQSEEILSKLRKKMGKNCILKDSNSKINYLAEKLVEDLKNNKSSFSKDLELLFSNDSLIECNSVTERILIKFREINPSGKSLLTEILESEEFDDKQKAKIIPQIVLAIGRILEEKTLDELKILGDEKFIETIFDNYDTYCEDIKADFILNKNEPEKLFIDLKRLLLRGKCSNEDTEVSEPNGKIDVNFRQGNTGDCWLLGGLASIFKKEKGKVLIESLLQVDKNTGDVKVTLKGVNKTYTISKDEIEGADYLSGGDGDIRALELAFDKYIREQAYSDKGRVDISGNTETYLYEVLLGKAESSEGYSKTDKWKFNSEDDYYCMGTSAYQKDYDKFENIVLKEDGTLEDFVTGHAYAIIKSDDKYVYIINPWNSKETLRITHEKLEEINPSIGHCKCS